MKDTLTITDNRTGKEYEIPITNSTIRAVDLRQIKVDRDEFGMLSYDPAFLNTAACQSRITSIDGDNDHWHNAPGEHQPLGHPANLPLVRRMIGLVLFTAQGGF